MTCPVNVHIQAFRRLVSQLALLLGPLWAPATLNNPMLMLAVPLGCHSSSSFNCFHISISRSAPPWCDTFLGQLAVDESGGGGGGNGDCLLASHQRGLIIQAFQKSLQLGCAKEI